MKRVLICVLVLAMTLSGVTAGAETRSGVNLSYDRVVEMCLYMRELVMGDYLDIKQAPQAMRDIAVGWAEGIDESPRLVVQLDIESQSFLVDVSAYFTNEPEIVRMEAISQAVITIWQLLAQCAAQESGVAAASYQEIMQVNGQINASAIYAEEGPEGNGMYIVLYENAAPILLIVNAENDAVSIRGMFLPSTRLEKCENYGQVAMYLMLNGFSMSCQEIKPE